MRVMGKFSRVIFSVITDFRFSNRHRRDNTPCRQLVDAANGKAKVVKLPRQLTFERLKVGRRVG